MASALIQALNNLEDLDGVKNIKNKAEGYILSNLYKIDNPFSASWVLQSGAEKDKMLHACRRALCRQGACALCIDPQVGLVRLGIRLLRGHMGPAGEVHHGIDAGQRRRPIRLRPQFGGRDIKNPGLFDPGATGRDDFVAAVSQSDEQTSADDAGCARNENPHILRVLKR
jgi:hypothetical protein